MSRREPMSISRMSSVFLFILLLASRSLSAQEKAEYAGKTGFTASVGYAPTSQHILTGHAQDRNTIQASFGYSRTLKTWSNACIAYEGSVQPLYIESDPTFIGTSRPNVTGPPTITYFSQPYRPIGLYGDFGYVYLGGNKSAAVAGLSGKRESTYAFATLPVGGRIVGFTKYRLQPTFAIDLGALYATRNIPVDSSSSFNFLAYAGPGLEFYWDRERSVRIEYLYEHLSNGNLGAQNPGIDSAAFRVTLTHYR